MSWNIRRDPFTGKQSRHDGIDLPFGMNEQMNSFQDGVVTKIENDPTGYGWYVDVKHDDGTSGRYAHAGIINKGVGHRVKRGEELGLVGSTGRSTGPHVHFEHRAQDGQPMDPRPFLAATGGRPQTQFASATGTAPTQNYGGPNMNSSLPLTMGMQPQGAPPAGMQDYVRQAQGLIGTTQPSPELIEAMTRNSQSRGQNLPLALGAMLSRDQGVQQFGGALYKDANEARNLAPIGEDGFVDPATGKYIVNPVGEDKKKQRVLEMSLRLAQQGEDAAARRAQSQQQFETNTILKNSMLGIQQQNADTAGLNAKTAQDGLNIKQADFQTKQDEERKVLELISQPNSPFKTIDDFKRNGGTVRNLAEKRVNEMREEARALGTSAAAWDEFYELNQKNPTGDTYDVLARNSPMAFQLNPEKQRMMQLNSKLQTDSVPSGQGAVSNLERELFSNAVPGLQFTTEANNSAYKAFNLRKSFREDSVRFMEDYFTKYGHLNGADQAAVEMLKAKYGPLMGGGANAGGVGGAQSGPPPAAVEFLKKNDTPQNREAFKSKYGSLPGGF